MIYIKLLGAILIVGATASAGLKVYFRLGGRVRCISSIITALTLLISELQFRLTPLPELLGLLQNKAPAPAGKLFGMCKEKISQLNIKPFSMIWSQAVSEFCAAEEIEAEKPILEELGGVLGRYDAENQIRAVSYAQRRLEIILEEARREKTKQGKMFGILGVITGLAIVIILY